MSSVLVPERPHLRVQAAPGGWPHPWPNVAEIADILPSEHWTLIGGLMVQLHTVHRGIGVVRPTGDVDIVLHIETSRGVPTKATRALQELGYRLLDKVDPRDNTAHRWIRDLRSTDARAGRREARLPQDGDQVDVLSADHAAPSVAERMNGRQMVRVEGGTQALRRTVNAALDIVPGRSTVLSVPRPFAAVILKSAAYLADSRDRDRHLFDAAALLACIEDPFVEAEGLVGSDRRRIRVLVEALPDAHRAWSALGRDARESGQGTLRILGSA